MKKLIIAITLIATTNAMAANAFCLRNYMKTQNRFMAQVYGKTNFFKAPQASRPVAPAAEKKRK